MSVLNDVNKNCAEALNRLNEVKTQLFFNVSTYDQVAAASCADVRAAGQIKSTVGEKYSLDPVSHASAL